MHHDQYNKNMLLEITSDNLQLFSFLDAETSMFSTNARLETAFLTFLA